MQEERIEEYKKAIELEPDEAYNYHDLGSFYIKTKEYLLAIEAYEKAIELELKKIESFNSIEYGFYKTDDGNPPPFPNPSKSRD